MLEKTEDIEPLVYNSSPSPTIGVEMEIWLVDKASRRLTSKAQSFLERFQEEPFVKKELWQCMIELNTRVCNDVKEARLDLAGSIARLERAADDLGTQLVSSGTHPYDTWRDLETTSDERYARLLEVHAWTARRLLICGLHAHVGVGSADKAIAVMNSVVSYLPHMLALSASSPFWHQWDTGLQSSRSKVFEGLPKAGLPPYIRNWAEFVKLMRTLLNSHTIQSIREIWWDVRPHIGFGTVEMRICDALPTLNETMALVAFAQTLVVHFCDLYDQGHPLPVLMRWTLVENKWRAIRQGLDAKIIRNERGDVVPIVDHLKETLELLAPTADRLGATADLKYLEKIVECGNSAMRQRRIWEATHDWIKVVDGLAWEFSNNQILEPGMEADL